MRARHVGVDARTYDDASVELPPRPENHLSGSRGGELVDVFTQNEFNPSCTQLRLHVFAELDRVGIVEEPIVALDDSDFLVLWRGVGIASQMSPNGTLTGYSSRSSPASSTEGASSATKMQRLQFARLPIPTAPPPTITTSSADLKRCCH